MPIYGNKLDATQYKLVTKISVTEYKTLFDVFKRSLLTFPYKDNRAFISSIEIDERYHQIRFVKSKYKNIYDASSFKDESGEIPFIAAFRNKANLGISDYNYGLMLESLIKKANSYLETAQSKYLLDIGGSWTNGHVIIMKK